ncbi:MAG: hypothetical protein GTO29_08735 [Candidatus Latescibacteria bacterium]|nr:hypothetical protein [Candidatus Latescibacterota bacterium]NIO56248.1 hypothetical protein [Candidatus Latescibacterota bacterium]
MKSAWRWGMAALQRHRFYGHYGIRLLGRYPSSFLTVSGEKAGRRTAMYSAPSGDRVLYWDSNPDNPVFASYVTIYLTIS